MSVDDRPVTVVREEVSVVQTEMSSRGAATARLLLWVVPALALSAGPLQAEPARTRPAIQLERANENWAPLADARNRTGPLDALKYIPLGQGLYPFLTIGGEARLRFESVRNARFGFARPRDDDYTFLRTLLHVDARLTPNLRAFVQFGFHDALGKRLPLTPSDETDVDLQQALVEAEMPFGGGTLRLRGGRQEIGFGTQRFVTVRDGPNIRQSHDGVRATWSNDRGWRLDAFAVRPVAIRDGAFDDETDNNVAFGGLHGAVPIAAIGGVLEPYVYLYERQEARFGAIFGTERRANFGARLSGRLGSVDYDWEGLFQTGEVGRADVAAFAFAADQGYTLATTWRPRLGLRLDIGSGDGRPNDGKVGTFNPLFPRGGYFNEAGLTSWANLIGLYPSLRITPLPNLTVEAGVQFRWRYDEDDAVYTQPLVPIAQTANVAGRYVGEVFNLEATWRINDHATLRSAYNYHTKGRVLERAGADEVQSFVLIAGLRF